MKVYVNGVQQGGGAGIPGTPADVLLNDATPSTLVSLDAQGAGTQMSYAAAAAALGVPSLPAAPSALLLNAGAPSTLVSLDAQGVGTQMSYAAAAAALGVPSVTTLNASNFVAVAGLESASILGDTFTISASGTARTYGSAGVTAARIIAALPIGWRTLYVEVQITAVTGTPTAGWRFATLAIQPQGSGTPTSLWGTSWPDTTSVYFGDRLAGGNSGGQFQTGLAGLAADRWFRMSMDRTEPSLAALVGSGSAGARPTAWRSTENTPPLVTGVPGIIDTSQSSWIVLAVQSFGTGGANSYTGKITVTASS